jgi:hypothetical protein
MIFTKFSRCAIVLASFSTLTFSQLALVTDPNNLVTNGGFDPGKEQDVVFKPITSHGAQGSSSIVDGQLVCVVVADADLYNHQIWRPNFALQSGVTYFMSFDAKANIERKFEFAIDHYGHDDGTGYAHYSDDPTTGAKGTLTTTMQTFSRTFTMPAKNDPLGRFVISIGAISSTVTFDNFILIDTTKIPKTAAFFPQIVSLAEAGNSLKIGTDPRGITFHFSNAAHCGYQIYQPSGKLVAGSALSNQGSASQYRIDYQSLGIASGKYVAQAIDGNQRYSKIFSVMP